MKTILIAYIRLSKNFEGQKMLAKKLLRILVIPPTFNNFCH